jgi:hypothetical protein
MRQLPITAPLRLQMQLVRDKWGIQGWGPFVVMVALDGLYGCNVVMHSILSMNSLYDMTWDS